MVRIDTSLRRIHRSEEVESAWRLVEESGEVFASEYWFDNLCLCAWDVLDYLHRLLSYSRVVDGYRVGVLFEFDESLGAECACYTLRDLLNFGLGSPPCRLVGYYSLLCSTVDRSDRDYEGLYGIDHSSRYPL